MNTSNFINVTKDNAREAAAFCNGTVIMPTWPNYTADWHVKTPGGYVVGPGWTITVDGELVSISKTIAV